MSYQSFATILLLFSLSNGFLAQTDSTEGDSDRVVGGRSVSVITFPYQVSIQKNNYHFCGGSIINNQTILTAAHCLKSFTSADVPTLSIVLGTSTWMSGGVRIPFKSFAIHQYFNDNDLSYDIALVIMKSPVTFTDAIQPIPLGTKVPVNGAQVILTGWGVVKNANTKPSNQLQGAQLDFITRKSCGESYSYDPKLITETMSCAGVEGKGSCRGDSGGPLMDLEKKTLVGIVSWGNICAAKGYPGVYTSVPLLRNWITTSVDAMLRK